MTLALRSELVATARRMHDLGLAPQTSGNVSVRTANGLLVTPSGLAYESLTPDDMVALRSDGSATHGQRVPSSEWRLHRDILAARTDCAAVVHTHSPMCTTLACLRRPLPAIHYLIALADCDEIPCADYATYGTAELAANVVRALASGKAALMANHGMVALGNTLASALKLAAEIETMAGLYWRALQIGPPAILDRGELARVRSQLANYGQAKTRPTGR